MSWELRKKIKNSKSDNDEDDNEDSIDIKIKNNHIYFYCDVSPKSAQQLNQAIMELNTPGNIYNEIWIHINSDGGTVYDVLSSIDTITSSSTPVVTLIEGMAASAATMLSIAGDRRLIRPNSVMLIHQLRGGYYGKKCDVKDEMVNLEKLEKKIIDLFFKNSTISKKVFTKMMKQELEYSAKECLKMGFVDEIYTGEKVLKKRKRN